MDTSLRLEDRLNGGGIFVPYKARIVLILQENELWDEVVHKTQVNQIQVHASTNELELASFNKMELMAKMVILDLAKDRVIPQLSGKDCAFKMWDALTSLYKSSNENQKQVLRKKLRDT